MRVIQRILIVLLVLLTAGQIFTHFYLGAADRKVPPVISCPDEVLEVSATDPLSVLLQGVTASDAQDGDLTNRVIVGGVSKLISGDTAKVTLLVFDSHDNMAKYTRHIRYTDYRRPRFTIRQPLVYSPTEEVSILERIGATDVMDGDLSNAIRISTLDASSDSSRYTITIQVTNSLGDTAALELPVLLLESDPLRPVVELSSYLVYLEKDQAFDPASLLSSVTLPYSKADLTKADIESNVDTSTPGVYEVTYAYTFEGRMGIAIATVVVQ